MTPAGRGQDKAQSGRTCSEILSGIAGLATPSLVSFMLSAPGSPEEEKGSQASTLGSFLIYFSADPLTV